MSNQDDGSRVMTKEDWEEILDSDLLYMLFDDYECHLAKVTSEIQGKPNIEQVDRLDRLLKAVVIFTARSLVAMDKTLSEPGLTQPNVIGMTSIMHLMNAFLTGKGYGGNV